ncbi:MAG: S8 family serine peptidase [Patescibacteria group bacterium]
MRQIILCLFFSWVMFAQGERAVFQLSRLTRDGVVTSEYWGDQLLVKFRGRPGSEALFAKSSLREASATTLRALAADEPTLQGYYTLQFAGSVQGLQALHASLVTDSSVEWVSFSPVIRTFEGPPTNDPLVHQQWALGDFPGSIGWASAPRLKSDNVYIIGVDTGACFGHEDFDWSRNFWNYNAINPSSPATDDNGHGCATMSVIAAKANNGKGIAGLADFIQFGFVKALDAKGAGTTENVVAGILAAARKSEELRSTNPKARVILNLSFGTLDQVLPIAEAIQVARKTGIVVIAAAGNSSLNIDRTPVTPASVPGVITVGASSWDNQVGKGVSWASNWGPKSVLLAAPGQDIDVAVPVGQVAEGVMLNPKGYRRADGTSFSAPHVAGAIALMLAYSPGLTEEQIRLRLIGGNRGMGQWRLNLRDYAPTELFRSGARLSLPELMTEDDMPPNRPLITLMHVGHSSVRLSLTGTDETLLGAECLHEEGGKERVQEFLPYFGSGNFLALTLTGPAAAPLRENAHQSVTCRVVDRAGNWSEWSEWVLFQTRESQSSSLDLAYSQEGPIGYEVRRLNGDNPILWHLADFLLLGGNAWYAGKSDALNYKGGVSDSELVTQVIDLRSVTGSVSLAFRHFLQMQGVGKPDIHFDVAEIIIKELAEDGRVNSKIIRENLPNTRVLGLEEMKFDLSEYSGKQIAVSFRFFTNGSSAGIGWILRDLQLKTDR